MPLIPPTVVQMEVGGVSLQEPSDLASSDPEPSYPSLDDLLAYCREFGIPTTAKVTYLGCGTHTIALEWTP